MEWRRRWLLAGVAALLAGGWNGAGAQTAPPQTTDEALQLLADAAGVIFTGTVTAVRRIAAATPGAAGVVEIDFAVTDAVRGVTGSTYTLREWAGLWPANDRPFAPGQRYLMLLHTPNAAGLSSPVGGPDGAIPIHGASTAPAGGQMLASTSSVSGADGSSVGSETIDVGSDTIDLGWIATRVSVPLAYQTSVARPIGGNDPVRARTVSASETTAATTQPAAQGATGSGLPVGISGKVRSAQYSTVLTELRSWEAARNDAR